MQTTTMTIKSHSKEYSVVTVNDARDVRTIFTVDDSLLVIDKNVWTLYRESLFGGVNEKEVYLLEAIEENKRIETALDICERMTSFRAKRNATIISIGGGITQDITGFAANVLYRGVHWEYIPTTLLAACDSCIGGKTSLNYKSYKNLLGTFFAPDNITIYPEFFYTLKEADYLSGLGEVLKFNFLVGREGIDRIKDSIDGLLARDTDTVESFLLSSLKFKKTYIEEDEFDRGVRIHLNFAHTFGHAFETMSHYAIPHGTAVAMGTIAANRVSLSRGWLDIDSVAQMEKLLMMIIPMNTNTIDINIDAVFDAMKKDKKQVGDSLTTVLMRDTADGEHSLEIVSDTSRDEVVEAVKYVWGLLDR